jgi:hypothetical protein
MGVTVMDDLRSPIESRSSRFTDQWQLFIRARYLAYTMHANTRTVTTCQWFSNLTYRICQGDWSVLDQDLSYSRLIESIATLGISCFLKALTLRSASVIACIVSIGMLGECFSYYFD